MGVGKINCTVVYVNRTANGFYAVNFSLSREILTLSGEDELHKPPCQTWHGAARRAKTAEALFHYRSIRWSIVRFAPDMKHSAFAPYDEKMRVCSRRTRKIRIKSPEILRCKRSVRPPPEKENHLKHTAVLCTVTPKCSKQTFPLKSECLWQVGMLSKYRIKLKKFSEELCRKASFMVIIFLFSMYMSLLFSVFGDIVFIHY